MPAMRKSHSGHRDYNANRSGTHIIDDIIKAELRRYERSRRKLTIVDKLQYLWND